MLLNHGTHGFANRLELLRRRQVFQRGLQHARRDLLANAGDAHLEELVEIAGKD